MFTAIEILTREDLLGDLFHVGGFGYYAQLTAFAHILGLQSGGHNILAAGTDTIGYEPNVDYFFGFPRSIKTGGIMFDIPIVRINGMNNGNLEQQKQFNIQFGLLSSALEHATPEMMFTNAQNPGEAISAVKALQKANAAGQRIYHITQANMNTVLPNIHHNVKTMEEIQNALNAGKEVITHTDAVSVPGWSGAGYIIFDSVTGDGAYKIGGGANGGWIDWLAGLFFGITFFSGIYLGQLLFAPIYLATLNPVVGAIGIFIAVSAILLGVAGLAVAYNSPGDNYGCFLGGFIAVLTPITSLLGKYIQSTILQKFVDIVAKFGWGYAGNGFLQCTGVK